MAQEAIQAKLGVAQTAVAMANGMKSKLFTLSKKDGKPYLSRHASTLIAKASDVTSTTTASKDTTTTTTNNDNDKPANGSSKIRDTTR